MTYWDGVREQRDLAICRSYSRTVDKAGILELEERMKGRKDR